jgi:hypothetical protein
MGVQFSSQLQRLAICRAFLTLAVKNSRLFSFSLGTTAEDNRGFDLEIFCESFINEPSFSSWCTRSLRVRQTFRFVVFLKAFAFVKHIANLPSLYSASAVFMNPSGIPGFAGASDTSHGFAAKIQ